jgi:uncharacterized protein (DUF2141 family)
MLVWSAATVPCRAGEIVVHVDHVSPKGGIVSAALFDRADYHDNDHPLASRNVAARFPRTTFTFSHVKPGFYAIKMFQDINRNGKFDTDLLGLPLEPYGFSNNVVPFLSEPGFDATRFRAGRGRTVITIRLSGTDGIGMPQPKPKRAS